MKKLITGLVALGMIAGAQLAPATAGKPKPQVVEGSVALPAPFTDDSGCYAGLHRRLMIVSGEAAPANGLIGYSFDIDPATWGGKFKMEPTGGQGTVDLDIYFYMEFGTTDDVVNDPQGAGAPATIQFNTRQAGGEAGVVPADFTKVIVCMYGGAQGGGGGATFNYTATPKTKKK
jgi:hypothetical protein